MPPMLANRPYDSLAVGDSARLTRVLHRSDIALFAALSGDVNPAHLDDDFARESRFHHVIAHGMWGGALVSTLLGTRLPGPGTIYVSQQLRFLKPVAVGDELTVTISVREKQERRHVLLDCAAVNQLGETVLAGEAEVIAPAEALAVAAPPLPEVQIVHPLGPESFRIDAGQAAE